MDSRRRALTEVQQFLSAPLGEIGQFYRVVTIPQIFVFVLLMVLGSVLQENVWYLLSKVTVVLAVLSAHLAIQSRRTSFMFIDLLLELLTILVLLDFFVLGARLDPGYALFLPGTLSLLSFALVPMRWAHRIVFSFVALAAYVPGLLFDSTSAPEVRGSWFLFCFAGVFAPCVLALVRSGDAAIPQARRHGRVEATPGAQALELEIADGEQFLVAMRRILAGDLSHELLVRFIPLAMLVAGIEWGATSALGFSDLWHCFASVMIAGALAPLFFSFRGDADPDDLWLVGFAGVIGLLCWWCLMTMCFSYGGDIAARHRALEINIISPWASQREIFEGPFSDLVLITIVLGVSGVGWPIRYSGALALVFGLIVFARLPSCPFPILQIGMSAVVAVAILYQSASGYVTLVASAIARAGVQTRIGSSDGVAGRLLALLVQVLTQSRRAALLHESGESELVSGLHVRSSSVRGPLVRELVRRYGGAPAAGVLVRSRTFGTEYLAPLEDWFSRVPVGLVLVPAGAYGERDGRLVVTPRGLATLLLPRELIDARIAEIHDLVNRRSADAAGDGAAGLTAAAATVLGEADREIGHIVHAVNNAAQSVTVLCDRIRRNTLDSVTLLGTLTDIEIIVRGLSTEISDARVLRELARLTSSSRAERIRLSSVLDDLEWYGQFLQIRRRCAVRFEHEDLEGLGIEVLSRGYLSALLRMLFCEYAGECDQDRSILLRVSPQQDVVEFALSADGGTKSDGDSVESDRRDLAFRAVSQFCRLSEATYQVYQQTADRKGELVLRLRRWLPAQLDVGSEKRWALLVDDNTEITEFYARAAEALGLASHSAASYEAAVALLGREGPPSLLVTDIHLGASTGLELIEAIRTRFGDAVPVIVVSGEAIERLSELGFDASRTRYLMKPVSRKRLFLEMREVLMQRQPS